MGERFLSGRPGFYVGIVGDFGCSRGEREILHPGEGLSPRS